MVTHRKPTTRVTYAVTGASRNSARRVILKGLIAYNAEHVANNRWKTFAVVANDARGRVLGGLSGYIGWSWMFIELFWLPQALRRRGHGRKLMQLAEEEARRRGCVGMLVDTVDFQAPGFYPKLGFRVYTLIEDYPPGHRRFYMMKRFTG